MNKSNIPILSKNDLSKKYSVKLREWKLVYGCVFGVRDEFFDEIFNRYMDSSVKCIECNQHFKSLRTKLIVKKTHFDYKKESNIHGFICRKCVSTQNKGPIKLHTLPNLPFEITPIYKQTSRTNWVINGKAYFESIEQFEQLFIRYCYANKCDYSGEIFVSRRERCAIFDRNITDRYNFVGFIKHSNVSKFRKQINIG